MTVQYINLSNLKIARENTRKTRATEQIKTLAASIETIGILHTLVGYKKKGMVHITDGGSRLQALRLIAKSKNDTGKLLTEIPVNICSKKRAIDVSLTANLVRSAMTPADQFTAFHKLHHLENVPVADIAKRYYVDSQTVNRILKLASLAKPIFASFKKGDISLDAAKSYAGCGDADRQLTAFEACGVNATVHTIRSALRENTYLADSARVAFVTLDAYIEKGGVLEEDLFDEKTVLLNGEIIDELMSGAIEAHTQSLIDEGWSQVTYFDNGTGYYEACQKQGNRIWQKCNPNKKQQAKLDSLSKRIEKMGYYWDLDEKQRAIHKNLETEYETLEQSASSFSNEDMKSGICLWYFDESGANYGTYALPVQNPIADRKTKEQRDYSESFEREVMAASGDALMEHLTLNPNIVTTAMTIAALECAQLPCVNFSMKSHGKRKFNRGQDEQLVNDGESYTYTNPTDTIKRVKELVAMSEADRQSILASLMRQAFTMGEQYTDQSDQMALYQYAAEQSQFSLSDYWEFGETELSCLTKNQLLRILGTFGLSANSFSKAKKPELVKVAARYVQEQNWSPEFVRIDEISNPDKIITITTDKDVTNNKKKAA